MQNIVDSTLQAFIELSPTFHEGLEIVAIPNELNFWAREDGTIWTTWINRNKNSKRNWKTGLSLLLVTPCIHQGRPLVSLWTRRCFIYTAILEAFIGPCPSGYECRHLDDEPLNNVLSNLCWGTHQDNLNDALYNAKQAKPPKFEIEAVIDIRQRYAAGETQQSIAAYYITSQSVIQGIISYKTYKEVHL